MAFKRYYTVNGRIRGESTGGVRTNYLHDALGSITATTNSAGAVINTYRYKPYGARLSKTGGGADPKFQWVGQHGYRTTSGVPIYVRARYYQALTGGWMTVDPIWPRMSAYGYVLASPLTLVDLSGQQAGNCRKTLPERDYAGRPILPPGSGYVESCCEARKHSLTWFYNQVRNGGPWDFKQQGGEYEAAGNYHFGFVAACLGIHLVVAQRFAGWAQTRSGNWDPSFGSPHGWPPYGDDPADWVNISSGWHNARKWMEEIDRKCRLLTMAGGFENFQDARDKEIDRIWKEGAELPRNTRWWDKG